MTAMMGVFTALDGDVPPNAGSFRRLAVELDGAHSVMQIDEVFRRGSGIQWDPRVVDALGASRSDIERIRQKGLGESLQIVVAETLDRSDSRF